MINIINSNSLFLIKLSVSRFPIHKYYFLICTLQHIKAKRFKNIKINRNYGQKSNDG